MNNVEAITKNWKQLIMLAAVLIGLIAGIYLVQNRQIFRSRAASEINTGLKVTDDEGQELPIVDKNTYETTDDYINVSIKNLQELISP